jgi:hypothetical protein
MVAEHKTIMPCRGQPVPIAIITVILQAALIIHVLKTGRDFRWIFLLIFLPGIGALIYFVIEILPSLSGGLTARRAVRRVGSIVDPGRDLRQQKLEYERNQSVDTATRLANELAREGKYDEAIKVCEAARAGVFEDDPTILLALAHAQFGKQLFRESMQTLELLRAKNPDFRSPEGHLLYARTLDEEGRADKAIGEYEALARYYPGAEARVRLAQAHLKAGSLEVAKQMFRQIVEDARLAPKHFQRAQREWIDIAKKAID